jgi:ABC-type phosphate transport system substrate-binding protein
MSSLSFGRSLAATLTLSAAAAAFLAVAPAANAQVPCVASDAAYAGRLGASCKQYWAGGASFPGLVLRAEADYYGIAIPISSDPTPAINTLQPGLGKGALPTSPTDAIRLNTVQYNYCNSGSGNGRNSFIRVAGTTGVTGTTGCQYTTSATLIDGTPGTFPGASTIAAFPTNTLGVDPLFAFTDTPLSSGNITSYNTRADRASVGPLSHVPVFFGAIVAGFNQQATTTTTTAINLSTLAACRIFDGTYTSTSDINANLVANGLPASFKSAALPLRVVFRSDASGTTQNFVTYLSAACNALPEYQAPNAPYYIGASGLVPISQVFTVRAGSPNAANFVSAPGNEGVADRVAQENGSTGFYGVGYIEASFSRTFQPLTSIGALPAPNAARLQNPLVPANSASSYILGTSITAVRNAIAGIGLTQITDPSDAANRCFYTVSGLTLGTPAAANAYPIVVTTYALNYSTNLVAGASDADSNAARRGLFNFILGNPTTLGTAFTTANDSIANGLGFVLTPASGSITNPTSGTGTVNFRVAARRCAVR